MTVPSPTEGTPVAARPRAAYVFAGYARVFSGSGGSVHIQEVAKALSRRGAEVHLFANRFGGKPLPGLEDVQRHALDPARGHPRAERASATPAENEGLRERLASAGPFDVVYERFSLGSYAAMEYAAAAGVPGILEINGPRIEKAADRGALADRGAAEAAAARAVGSASAVFAVSEGVADYVAEKFDARDRLHVVPNGVDPDRFPPALLEARAARDGPFTTGFVGTFKAHHGLDTLVEAFAALRRSRSDARLVLVGDGPERAAVEARLFDLRLGEASVLTGHVDPREVPRLLAEMDVGVAPFPARRSYVSPLKVFEYLAAGLPVVASGADQLAHLIIHGETGMVCEPDDAPSLAAALDLLAGDPRLRARMGCAGREYVLANHSWDRVAARILAIASDRQLQ